jgi:digeranylgeranylglycerophospholipid reductase
MSGLAEGVGKHGERRDKVAAEPCAENPEVLVVGLGPAGACAAAAAAAAGCRVLAIERRSSIGEPVQCAELVSAALSLEALPWDSVTSQRITRMVTAVEQEHPHVAEGFPGRMICRRRFDQALAQRAAACGARLVLGTAVTRVFPEGRVQLSDGRVLRPCALVAADGPRSQVGAAVGRVNRELVAARQLTVALPEPYEATDIFLKSAYRGGYGWLFPKGREANVGVGVDYACRERLKPLLEALTLDLTAAGRVGSARPVGLTGGLIPVGGRLRAIGRLGAAPVALAGDAAGLTNPVTGAGIEAAVRSGDLAGRAVAGWLSGNATALEDYEEELSELYDAPYARALRHRREVERCASPATLRRGWITSPEYWK